MEIVKNIRPSSVKLNQSVSGKIGWEIRVEDDDPKKLMERMEELNNMMKEKFREDLNE